MLPVTDDGTPDYAYIEQYAKNLMIKNTNSTSLFWKARR